MSHYISNIRDMEFALFEHFGLGPVLATGEWGEIDEPTVHDILTEVRRLAEGPLAECFASSDRTPPTFDPGTHTVHLPADFKHAVATARKAEWWRLALPAELDGLPMPSMVRWSVNELLLGANPAAFMLDSGPASASVLYRNGTPEQQRWARIAVDRGWGSTMALTEPEAGSDVGAGRTKAIAQPDGSWHIEGTKRFITSADSDDLYENTFHLVLARPEGAGPGTKGLSLFYVPKFHFDWESEELGDRNGVFVTGLEHKMGLKSSATCEVVFGGHGIPATGWLVGETHNGIAQMFDVIENARMVVGTKAIATLSTGYLNALQYAKERVQGPDLQHATDAGAPRVTIINHPDVRRSLALQKAYAEGLRAIYLFTAAHQDSSVAEHVSGATGDLVKRINHLMLPIVKGVGSERAYQYLTESLQTFGGSGYLQDHPIEQYIRDAKIDSLYEGTTAIQAQDFLFRKILRDNGAAFGYLMQKIDDFAADDDSPFPTERALLAAATQDVKSIVDTLTTAATTPGPAIYRAGLGSVRALLAFGDLLIGWLLLDQAATAQRVLDASTDAADSDFYRGKVMVGKFFAHNILPELSALAEIVSDIDLDVMQAPEASF
ncbi:acyl-CoA dehydrogenase [Rhodococcus zopfii]|uniref:acyl-CoA dehydrogenase n=1 Tax=Gordonia sp. PP30 TaxID=2935861 RepID=UPI0020005624|nr:acyl-CoA dehydrogenase [Gordonia sp. PP30]UQE75248.1 acyl-CoA dehydrogenase [Gordonia sp. PP30]